MDKEKKQVFVSYSHTNRSACDSIVALLKKVPLDVWYDQGLIPGEVFRKKIVETIRNSDYFIVLLSAQSARSEWVMDEVEYAKKQHKRILPIFIDDTVLPDDLDMILQRYHSLFWHLRSSDRQFEESLAQVFTDDKKPADAGRTEGPLNFGEFSEADNKEMRRMLQLEKEGAFSKCYSAEGACLLGKAYMYGCSCPIDLKKAGFYFKVALYRGNLDAGAYLLHMQLQNQEAATWDEPDEEFCRPIIEKMHSLADQGSEAAMMLYAHYLWYGRYGCAQDLVKSAQLYEICAKQGNARAQYIMSSNYYQGDGVDRDYDLAIMYANLALEQKYSKSWRRLGKFHRDGLAVPQDYKKAREYYERGAREGDFNCYNKVGDMLYYGWGFDVDYQKAFEYYLKGEQAPEAGQKYGLWKAKQALGRCYELGHGTQPDLEAAAQKYLDGYRLGSEECKKDYVRCGGMLAKLRGDLSAEKG